MTDFPRILPGCLMVALVLTLTACFDGSDKTKGPNPPVARVQDHIIEQHGLIRNDEYYWLRDDSRQDPEVLSLLAAENQYATDYMAPLSGLQDQIYREITARLTNDDRSVAINDGSYAYHREFVPGGEQPVYFRTLRNSNHKSEIILDQNRLSSGHAFYAVGSWRTSPDDKLLAFTEDTVGRNQFRLRFRNLDSGEFLPDSIVNVSDSIAWSEDSRWIFYVRQDEQTLLPRQVYRHRLGTPVASDVLVYEETDRAFYTTVSASRSRSLILISSDSIDASELQFIPADQPESAPQMFQRREAGHRFVVRHLDGNFYILSNRDAPEYRLMIAADTVRSEPEKWRELMPYRPQVSLTDLEVFDRYIAVGETEAGLPRIRVMDRSEPAMPGHLISFPDPSYHALLAFNHDHQSEVIRYAYSSLRAPDSVYEYHPGLDHSYLLKQDEVVGDFDPVNYTVERLWIDARDGERVPVSLVYRTGLFRKGENPLYIEAYGAYGLPLEPDFRRYSLSLLDRGVVYAVAHIRGGGELGQRWYDDGRLLNKRKTFSDFEDVTDALVKAGYGHRSQVIAAGGSAGGLLMGVLANEAPEKYLAVIARVPFVDVVTTMSDAGIPLTVGEYDEWGNPALAEYFRYMLSYSPYDQVRRQDYPNMLVTASLYDSQVQYFEPVKWVSRIRKLKTDNNALLLRVNMAAGHTGASGRYERYRDVAFEYAFILGLMDKAR